MSEIKFETYWRGGPGGPSRAISLANAAAEAVHTLNYATMSGNGGLVYPSNVGSVLSGLAAVVGHMHQLLDQLADFTGELGADPRLYHDQLGESAQLAATHARAKMQAAASLTDMLGRSIERAYALVNHLGVHDTIEGQDEGAVDVDDQSPTTFSASGVPR